MERQPAGQTVLEIEHAIGNTCKLNNTLHVHPNNKDLVYAGGGCVIVRDFEDPHQQHFLRGHDNNVTCLDISNSGRYISSGQTGKNADVCVWDFDSRKLIFRLNEHEFGVAFCKFSRDEKLLLTVGDVRDNRIIVWDLSNGYVVVSTYLDKQLRKSAHDQTAVRKPCVGAWGGHTRDVKKRETRNYQFVCAKDNDLLHFVLDPYKGRIDRFSMDCKNRIRNYTCLYFNEFGDRLFAGTESGDIIVFNMFTRQYISRLEACSRNVTNILLFNESKNLVVGGGDGSVTEFERVVSSRSYYQHQEKIVPLKKIEFQKGGNKSASNTSFVHSIAPYGSFFKTRGQATDEKMKLLVGISSGETYQLGYEGFKATCFSEAHGDEVYGIAFSENISDKFATCSRDRTVKLWDSTSYKVLADARFRESKDKYPITLSFVKDILFTGWSDGSVRTIDSLTGDILWERKEAHRDQIKKLACGKNCKFFLSGGEAGNIKVWSVKGMNLVSSFKDHRSLVTDLCLFDDDVHFLSSSRDKYVLCWDLRKEKCVGTYYCKGGPVDGVCLRKNQTQFVSIGGKHICVWDIRQPKPTHVLKYSPKRTDIEGTCVDFSPSGKYFVCGGTDEVVKLFDFETKKLLSRGKGHSKTVLDVKFSPDEKQVISTGADGMIFLWNLFQF